MPGENSANTPIKWPEVLQTELESFGFPPIAVDLTKSVGHRLDEVHERIRMLQPDRSARRRSRSVLTSSLVLAVFNPSAPMVVS